MPVPTTAAAAGYISIGDDLSVPRLGYGAMRIVGQPGNYGQPANREASLAVLRRAIELGIRLIDTADAYGPGVSEDLIAEALHPYPGDLVLATKGGVVKTGPGQMHTDASPGHLRRAVDASLRRLRVDRIDLYQLHRPDPGVPFEESITALAALRGEGKVRHLGLSNVTAEQLTAARRITPIASVQNRYSLADRGDDALVDACAADGLVYLPYGPLGADPFQRQAPLAAPGGALEKIAVRHGVSSAAVALAWLLTRSPALLPIAGTTSVTHLEDNIQAAELRLTDQDLEQLERR